MERQAKANAKKHHERESEREKAEKTGSEGEARRGIWVGVSCAGAPFLCVHAFGKKRVLRCSDLDRKEWAMCASMVYLECLYKSSLAKKVLRDALTWIGRSGR